MMLLQSAPGLLRIISLRLDLALRLLYFTESSLKTSDRSRPSFLVTHCHSLCLSRSRSRVSSRMYISPAICWPNPRKRLLRLWSIFCVWPVFFFDSYESKIINLNEALTLSNLSKSSPTRPGLPGSSRVFPNSHSQAKTVTLFFLSHHVKSTKNSCSSFSLLE